jgi:putative ABC transporter-associated repeat protein
VIRAVLTIALLLLTAAPGAVASTRTVVADGHIDLGPRLVNGAWTVQIRDDTVSPAVWRDLSDVVVQVPDAARTQIPPDGTYGFLGRAGDPVWLLPQVQRPGVVWPGWNTQDPEVVAQAGREVTWRLNGMRGPGTFVLFLSGNFGAPEVIFASTRPYPQETGIELNTHAHGNWAFSAPGTYSLDIEMTGTTKDGRTLADRRTLRLHVGDGRPESAFDATTTPTVAAGAGMSAEPSTPPADPTPWGWIAAGVAVVVLGGGIGVAVFRRFARG